MIEGSFLHLLSSIPPFFGDDSSCCCWWCSPRSLSSFNPWGSSALTHTLRTLRGEEKVVEVMATTTRMCRLEVLEKDCSASLRRVRKKCCVSKLNLNLPEVLELELVFFISFYHFVSFRFSGFSLFQKAFSSATPTPPTHPPHPHPRPPRPHPRTPSSPTTTNTTATSTLLLASPTVVWPCLFSWLTSALRCWSTLLSTECSSE